MNLLEGRVSVPDQSGEVPRSGRLWNCWLSKDCLLIFIVICSSAFGQLVYS